MLVVLEFSLISVSMPFVSGVRHLLIEIATVLRNHTLPVVR